MARSHQVRARNSKGSEVSISSHDTDAPILPVVQLEKLQQFRPDLVDFIVDQTQKEAEFRRAASIRVNQFIFIERIFGMVCSLLIGISGIVGGGYVGLQGQPILGGTIATAALGTLAIAFIKKNQAASQDEGEPK